MYFIQLKKPKLFYLFIALVIIFGFFSIWVKAEEDYLLLPEKTFEVAESKDLDYKDYSDINKTFNYRHNKTNNHNVNHSKRTKNYNVSSDLLFDSPNKVTLHDLIMRVFFIVLFLLGVFILFKLLFFRNSFDKPGNFFNYLTQKLNNSFSNSCSLKLIQSLMLAPGQSVYVIEVNGKELLIGGTQQGGIQFLADLSKSVPDLSSKDITFKPLEEFQIQAKHLSDEVTVPFSIPKVMSRNGNEENNEKEEKDASRFHGKHSFKKRINFRQTLLSNPDKINTCTLSI